MVRLLYLIMCIYIYWVAKAKKASKGGKKFETKTSPSSASIGPSSTVCTGANIYNEGEDPKLKVKKWITLGVSYEYKLRH